MKETNRAGYTEETMGLTPSRYTEDMESLRLKAATESDSPWGIDRWVEEEKKRLWLGYFAIKL